MKSLNDKVVVITGAGSGIGRALALNLAGKGALLALSDVNETGLAETVKLALDAGAPEVRSDRLDVADREAFKDYAAAVATQFGRVNVVVNNAGVALAGELQDTSYEDMDWIMGINFWGVVHGTKEFLPHLIASGDGHIVNISSLFGLLSFPRVGMYNASKYAVRGLSESLRQDLIAGGHKVGLTVVHPGGIKTNIAKSARLTENEDPSGTEMFGKLLRTTPDKAGEVIVRGILRNQPRVLIGLDAHATHQWAKLTGARYQDIVGHVTRRIAPPTKG